MKTAITYPDFDKIDIRVGTILHAEIPDWSKKLLQFTVDFGTEIGQRTIFSGIQQWYTPEDFMNKQFAFIVNLEPKKMGDSESQGMMLMADGVDEEGKEHPVLMPLPTPVVNGTVIR